MHELSIAHSILTIAENAIPPGCTAPVKVVGLQIGALSGIELSSLEFAFFVIKADTLLQHAVLEIEIIPGEAVCTTCDSVFPLDNYGTCCPRCNGYSMKILKGREMKVLNIIVDE
jgi:hydrogenase nickel incorporation protein HypA/HybF